MKKNIFIAVLTVSGLVFVSCSADTDGLENIPQNPKKMVLSAQNKVMFSKEGDSIRTTTMLDLTDGPGDGSVISPSPPKP